MEQTPPTSVAVMTDSTTRESGASTTSVRKAAVLVGLCFLTATLTFAIGNALVHSYPSSASAHFAPIAGVVLLGCCGVAVAANGVAMRGVLTPHTPIRSRAYLVLRAAECLTLMAVGVYLLTSHTYWDGYVLAVYAVSGAAGLVLSSALLASRIVPRNLSLLGLVGYPVFLVGTVLAMLNLVDVTHGAGMLALVPVGLFELILPIRLFAKGHSPPQRCLTQSTGRSCHLPPVSTERRPGSPEPLGRRADPIFGASDAEPAHGLVAGGTHARSGAKAGSASTTSISAVT